MSFQITVPHSPWTKELHLHNFDSLEDKPSEPMTPDHSEGFKVSRQTYILGFGFVPPRVLL